MADLYSFTHELFLWCQGHNIGLALIRPKYNQQDFVDSDLDILVDAKDIQEIVNWITSNDYKVTCRYERHDGITVYFFHESNNLFFHIDFITSLQIRGIDYLGKHEVLGRSINLNGISYPDKVDQFTILIATHGIKHQHVEKLETYNAYLKECIKEYPASCQERLEHLVGSDNSAMLVSDINAGTALSVSFLSFMAAAWKTHGLMAFGNLVAYLVKELYLRFTMPKYKIAFLGIDGAGKTSIIDATKPVVSRAVPIVRHAHFMPSWPWKKEKDSAVTQSNPHDKPRRSYAISVIKLVYFFISYWIVELYPSRTPVLYLYDRYLYDITVDPVRFRYNGPGNDFLYTLFNYCPKPDLCFIVDITPEIAYERKPEISLSEMKRQVGEYRELSNRISPVYILKNEFPLDKVTSIATKLVLGKLTGRSKHDL